MVAAAFQLMMVLNACACKDTKEKHVKVIIQLTQIFLCLGTAVKWVNGPYICITLSFAWFDVFLGNVVSLSTYLKTCKAKITIFFACS